VTGCILILQPETRHPEECQKEDPEFDAWCDKVIEAQQKAS